MNSLPKIISIAVLLLIGFASAAEQIYSNTRTKEFANHILHGFPGLNTKAAAGLGTGFGILGCLMIFSCAMIVLEELNKHKDQNNKIRSAHDRMRELGLNLSEIDAEYDEQLRFKGKSDQEIADIKAKEAKKRGGSHVDQGEHGERL